MNFYSDDPANLMPVDYRNTQSRLNAGLSITNSHEDTPILCGGGAYIPWRPESCFTLRTSILVSNGIPTGQPSLAQICTPPTRPASLRLTT